MSQQKKIDQLDKAITLCRKHGMGDKDIFDLLRIGSSIYKFGDGLTFIQVSDRIDPTGGLFKELVATNK